MRRHLAKLFLAGLAGLLAACAIITVNVYFPEKAVKEAYKSLDDMLLTRDQGKPPSTDVPAEPQQKPAETQPQSRLRNLAPGWSLVATAWAAENYADDLAVELSSMPEVLKAYDDMSARLPWLVARLDSGVVGLTNQGLIEVRDLARATPQDAGLVKAENTSRKVVITGMAKAIVKLNLQRDIKASLEQVLPRAAASYAETKREEAKPGWWLQLPNGRWVQK